MVRGIDRHGTNLTRSKRNPNGLESVFPRHRECAEPTRETAADVCTAYSGLVAATIARSRIENTKRAVPLPIRRSDGKLLQEPYAALDLCHAAPSYQTLTSPYTSTHWNRQRAQRTDTRLTALIKPDRTRSQRGVSIEPMVLPSG